jgi:hypothetical protein
MRALITLVAALVLSACTPTPREPAPPVFVLDGNGIAPTVSGLRIDFGRAQVGVVETVSRLLRERPAETSFNAECGAGPITSVRWDDGLMLNFMDGSFMGWTSTDPDLPAAGGISAGQPRLSLPQVSFQVTSLGTEFARGEIFGILDPTDTNVQLIYSGVTCFFR